MARCDGRDERYDNVKTEIKTVNKLIIQGQEFEMSIQDLKDLRDAIDKIVGEKVKVVPVQQPIVYPEKKRRPLGDEYETWINLKKNDIYPKIWMQCSNK